jgi:hypothetical protein
MRTSTFYFKNPPASCFLLAIGFTVGIAKQELELQGAVCNFVPLLKGLPLKSINFNQIKSDHINFVTV